MYETINNVIDFLADKTEWIEALYVKYIPKIIRFILYPLTQVILGLIVVTTVTAVLFVSIFISLYIKTREAYKNYR